MIGKRSAVWSSRPRTAGGAALLVLAIIASGCASSGGGAGRGEPAVGTSVIAMDDPSSERLRSYLFHPPSAGLGQAAVPLVVVLGGAQAAETEELTGFSAVADRERFVVVYPEATGRGADRSWNAGFCCPPASDAGVDDVGFVLRVVDHVAERVPVDQDRVYVVGYSEGGMLAHRLAAERPGRLAAAAVVSGAIGGRTTGEDEPRMGPTPVAPLPILIMHGLDDDSIPYWEAEGRRGIAYVNVIAAVEVWVRGNMCRVLPRMVDQRDGQLLRRSFAGRAPVELVVLKGWGHDWPSTRATSRLPSGEGLHGFDAAELIWAFFADKTRAVVAVE